MVIGNLGRDPELRHLPSGQPVVGFSIATDETYTDKHGQKQEHVEWHRVVAFGKLAETCGEYLKKGRQVYAGASQNGHSSCRIRTISFHERSGVWSCGHPTQTLVDHSTSARTTHALSYDHYGARSD
jgi:single-strand DNA-binding protein